MKLYLDGNIKISIPISSSLPCVLLFDLHTYQHAQAVSCVSAFVSSSFIRSVNGVLGNPVTQPENCGVGSGRFPEWLALSFFLSHV